MNPTTKTMELRYDTHAREWYALVWRRDPAGKVYFNHYSPVSQASAIRAIRAGTITEVSPVGDAYHITGFTITGA